MKIVVGVPTLNRVDLLEPCLRSLLAQIGSIEKIVVVDNGNQNIPYENLDQVHVIKNKTNVGVCTSWNQILEIGFQKYDADWVLMLNDDVALNIRQIDNSVLPLTKYHDDKWILVSPFYWSVWMMSREGGNNLQYEKGKWFDEELFPGYYGDNDMQWRIENLDPTKLVHGVSLLTPEVCGSSETLKKAPELHREVAKSGQRYWTKWGGGPSMEIYKNPFNIAEDHDKVKLYFPLRS